MFQKKLISENIERLFEDTAIYLSRLQTDSPPDDVRFSDWDDFKARDSARLLIEGRQGELELLNEEDQAKISYYADEVIAMIISTTDNPAWAALSLITTADWLWTKIKLIFSTNKLSKTFQKEVENKAKYIQVMLKSSAAYISTMRSVIRQNPGQDADISKKITFVATLLNASEKAGKKLVDDHTGNEGLVQSPSDAQIDSLLGNLSSAKRDEAKSQFLSLRNKVNNIAALAKATRSPVSKLSTLNRSNATLSLRERFDHFGTITNNAVSIYNKASSN